MIEYKHPELWIDGISAGSIVSAIANYPDKLLEIQAAIDTAWAAKFDDSAIRAELTGQIQTQFADQIKAAMSENRALRDLMARVMPDFSAIVIDLKAQGFYDWAAAAITLDSELIDEVADLKKAADENNVSRLIDDFRAISKIHKPTTAQLKSWQAVLDTHKIPKAMMAFIR